MQETLKAINQMQADGVIEKYAIGGAVGATFYIEPTATYDIDVFISFSQQSGLLVSLGPLYDYLQKRGYKPDEEHMMIEGWQVQFLPADDPLQKEALESAVHDDAGGVPVWVMTAEHLMAIALRTGRGKDLIRLEKFVTSETFNPQKFNEILARHQLEEKWRQFNSKYIQPSA
jgi:hypothetical protein